MSRSVVLRLIAPVLAALVLLGGCSQSREPVAAPTPSTSPTASATPVPQPARDVCFDLTYDEAVAPTSTDRTADCSRQHTSETFAVGQLKTIDQGHLLAVDATAVQQQVASTCPKRLSTFAGGTPDDLRLSMLRAVWFTPTVEQSDAGANWFRCDAIVVAREGSLAPVKGRLAGVLGTPEGRDRYGMCGTAQPGSPDFQQVICRSPHTWRAIRTVALTSGPYPGEAAVRAAGQSICDDAAKARASDALDYQWGYEWPTAEQWSTGQTYGRCWAPDA